MLERRVPLPDAARFRDMNPKSIVELGGARTRNPIHRARDKPAPFLTVLVYALIRSYVSTRDKLSLPTLKKAEYTA